MSSGLARLETAVDFVASANEWRYTAPDEPSPVDPIVLYRGKKRIAVFCLNLTGDVVGIGDAMACDSVVAAFNSRYLHFL